MLYPLKYSNIFKMSDRSYDKNSRKIGKNDKKSKGRKKSKKSNKKSHDKYHARMNKLDKINHEHFPVGFDTRVLSRKPYIVKIRRFMNSEEIDVLLNMAEGKFEKSTIIVSDEMVQSTSRTSETAFITDDGHYETYSKPVEKLLRKVCYLAGCERYQIESLMVVKYGNGDEYEDHHDYFRPEHTDILSDGGQRICTFFCYLNSLDPGDGGETEFPLIDVKAKPSKGTAVFWWDMKPSGKLLSDTLHRGNPVLAETTKYGLNIWVREHGW